MLVAVGLGLDPRKRRKVILLFGWSLQIPASVE